MNLIPGVAASEELAVLEQAAYQATMYLPLTDEKLELENGDSITEIIQKTQKAINDGEFSDPKEVAEYNKHINELIEIGQKHPSLMESTIGAQSWTINDPTTGKAFQANGLAACTFTSSTGNTTVSFRGTPGGSWIDNAKGITGVLDADYLEPYHTGINDDNGKEIVLMLSPMQCASLRYMDKVSEGKMDLLISGHSKGGNEAQLAAILFADRIKYAYSFDGQSFPKETLALLQAIAEDNKALDKILGINADNDYVNGLAPRLTLPGNTLFLQTPNIGGNISELFSNHYILALLSNGNLTNRGVPGPVSKTISRLSNDLLNIEDPELREAICFLVMSLLQRYLANEPAIGGEDANKMILENGAYLLLHADEIKKLMNTPEAREILGDNILDYLNKDNLLDYLFLGEPAKDAAEEFLPEHDFETEQQIADYLNEHTENGKLEYLVRGALLRCRHGTHARQLNLLKCHGVYITSHPVIHEANCIASLGPKFDNITYFGICNAPVPPPTDIVRLVKDVPRSETGAKTDKQPPGGYEKGRKCQMEIVGRVWLDTYAKTRIVDNGGLDSLERNAVDSDKTGEFVPDGRNAVTTLSFLVCRYGGLIEPYNSGQNYASDAAEIAHAKKMSALDHVAEAGVMHTDGGGGGIHGKPITLDEQYRSLMSLNGQPLSAGAIDMVSAMAHIERYPNSDEKTITYNWHNIEYAMHKEPEDMSLEQYQSLCYIFGSMNSAADIERFVNMGYTTKEIPAIEKPQAKPGSVLTSADSYAYFAAQGQQQVAVQSYKLNIPTDVMQALSSWYLYEDSHGTLGPEYALQADIMKAIAEEGTETFAPIQQNQSPFKVHREGFEYLITFPSKTKGGSSNAVSVKGPHF